uniref:Uncharacterized protein n=1 Tax=Rhizophora mucronata TaxID=61149 RepID=A0A2P2MXV6_RHIMU
MCLDCALSSDLRICLSVLRLLPAPLNYSFVYLFSCV